ncbi:MAG TPA: RDD family protein [Elusimicrobiales bacterium]|nr:RDD family protein [Elusimicrobiales bacterium]HOL62144.1 RDD family protein [Elusimicrobiales bacterium]HPO95977.1 RDD family protein [Elusimicrobiales bacterium]
MNGEINLDLNDIKKEEATKEEETYRIAGFNERFLAYLIDTLPFVFLNYYSLTFLIKTNYLIYSDSLASKWKWGWIALFIIYEVIFTSGGRVTLGKKLLGIRVVSKNGENLSIIKAFIRVIGYFISSFTLNLGYIAALTNKNRVSLHDLLASSRVIRTREKSPFVEGAILVLSWGLMAFFVAGWANRTVLQVTPSEKKQINEARRTLAKLAKLQEIHYRKYGFYTNDIKKLAELTGDIKAVRYELSKTLAEGSLEMASDGKSFVITAKAKNWRKTQVEISNLQTQKQ